MVRVRAVHRINMRKIDALFNQAGGRTDQEPSPVHAARALLSEPQKPRAATRSAATTPALRQRQEI